METKKIEQLFRTYYGALCLYATHYVGDIDEAEDIVMDCFTKFHSMSDKGEQILSVKSYLYQMVRNKSIEHYRLSLHKDTTHVIPDISTNDQELIEQSERELRLWREIDALPDACRNIFLLSKRDGMKNREIAEELGISIKTVEAQITKAYQRLRSKAKAIYLIFF